MLPGEQTCFFFPHARYGSTAMRAFCVLPRGRRKESRRKSPGDDSRLLYGLEFLLSIRISIIADELAEDSEI